MGVQFAQAADGLIVCTQTWLQCHFAKGQLIGGLEQFRALNGMLFVGQIQPYQDISWAHNSTNAAWQLCKHDMVDSASNCHG